MTRFPRAFTLIELLVVVTIIVVLLSLLTPALDKAIYQAELARCGANLKGIGGAVLVYAGGNKRSYPHRPTASNNGTPTNTETSAIVWNGPPRDDRVYLRSHLSVRMLVDPLNKAVDLDHAAPANFYIYSSYSLWWNWTWFNGASRGRTTRKLGDRFGLPDEEAAFGVLASDFDRVATGSAYAGAHPDSLAVASPWVTEQTPSGVVTYSFSLWAAADASQRGTLDRNFLYQDGSVLRLDKLTIDPKTDAPDERLVAVPERSDLANAANLPFKEHIPLR